MVFKLLDIRHLLRRPPQVPVKNYWSLLFELGILSFDPSRTFQIPIASNAYAFERDPRALRRHWIELAKAITRPSTILPNVRKIIATKEWQHQVIRSRKTSHAIKMVSAKGATFVPYRATVRALPSRQTAERILSGHFRLENFPVKETYDAQREGLFGPYGSQRKWEKCVTHLPSMYLANPSKKPLAGTAIIGGTGEHPFNYACLALTSGELGINPAVATLAFQSGERRGDVRNPGNNSVANLGVLVGPVMKFLLDTTDPAKKFKHYGLPPDGCVISQSHSAGAAVMLYIIALLWDKLLQRKVTDCIAYAPMLFVAELMPKTWRLGKRAVTVPSITRTGTQVLARLLPGLAVDLSDPFVAFHDQKISTSEIAIAYSQTLQRVFHDMFCSGLAAGTADVYRLLLDRLRSPEIVQGIRNYKNHGGTLTFVLSDGDCICPGADAYIKDVLGFGEECIVWLKKAGHQELHNPPCDPNHAIVSSLLASIVSSRQRAFFSARYHKPQPGGPQTRRWMSAAKTLRNAL